MQREFCKRCDRGIGFWASHDEAPCSCKKRGRPLLIFVMGPTCSGKSTFLELMSRHKCVGLVEVGKMMRAKYPPEHFNGQNNPKHTAAEAWQMCLDGVWHHRGYGSSIILVDGQPRDVPQVGLTISDFPENDFERHYWLIDADLEERERRARESRKGADLETLAIPRLTNDMIAYYSVLKELLLKGQHINVFDSTNPLREPPAVLFRRLEDSIFNLL